MTNPRKVSDDELKRQVDEELDEALKATFPASDPVAPLLVEEPRGRSA